MTKTAFSLEVFPPNSSTGIADIYSSMGRFRALNPDYISVTYGAGGGATKSTIDIASAIKQKFLVESVAHLTCADSTKEDILSALERLKESGVNRILALRGDLRPGREIKDFRYATDLIKFINGYGGFEVCAACYTEKHSESKTFDDDLEVLEMKADLGVSHFITQIFFDNAAYFRLKEQCLSRGIKQPVQAGIMPLINAKNVARIETLSGAPIPKKVKLLVDKYGGDSDAMFEAGVSYAVCQIADLIASGADGIHLYTMNNPALAERIMQSAKHFLKQRGDN